jgi:hypothetical protein
VKEITLNETAILMTLTALTGEQGTAIIQETYRLVNDAMHAGYGFGVQSMMDEALEAEQRVAAANDQGYEEGFADGMATAYDDGDETYAVGFNEGYAEAYNAGHEAYSNGFNEGYDAATRDITGVDPAFPVSEDDAFYDGLEEHYGQADFDICGRRD